MFQVQSFIGRKVAEYQAHRANKNNFHRLHAMDDRQLAATDAAHDDPGFGRKPRKLGASTEARALKAKRKAEKHAIKELRAMSDAELYDLGIARCNIVEAVRFGRTDFDEQPISANAARKSTCSEQKRAA